MRRIFIVPFLLGLLTSLPAYSAWTQHLQVLTRVECAPQTTIDGITLLATGRLASIGKVTQNEYVVYGPTGLVQLRMEINLSVSALHRDLTQLREKPVDIGIRAAARDEQGYIGTLYRLETVEGDSATFFDLEGISTIAITNPCVAGPIQANYSGKSVILVVRSKTS